METDNRSLRRLPDGAELSDLLRAYPVGVRELLAYHAQVLRHPDEARADAAARRQELAAVAELSGYDSEAAFAKALKRMIGVGAGATRRH